VEQTRTSSGVQPRALAASSQVRSVTASPPAPVAALALPELRTTAAAWAEASRCRRDTKTGAAATRLVVNTPAAGTGRPSLVATTARSGRPDGLIPAWPPAAENPFAAVTLIEPSSRLSRYDSDVGEAEGLGETEEQV